MTKFLHVTGLEPIPVQVGLVQCVTAPQVGRLKSYAAANNLS